MRLPLSLLLPTAHSLLQPQISTAPTSSTSTSHLHCAAMFPKNGDYFFKGNLVMAHHMLDDFGVVGGDDFEMIRERGGC